MDSIEETGMNKVLNYTEQRHNPQKVALDAHRSRQQIYNEKEFGTGDIAEVFHENTKHSKIDCLQMDATKGEMDSTADKFVQIEGATKQYESKDLKPLPTDVDINGDVGEVIGQRRSCRNFSGESLTLRELSAILKFSLGINQSGQVEVGDGKELTRRLRTYPSAGGLYLGEPYVVGLDVEGLRRGVYHYSPTEHGLRCIEDRPDGLETQIDEAFSLTDLGLTDTKVSSLSAVIIFTGSFWRGKLKYGPRAYRYALLEAGHMSQNILLSVAAMDIGALPVGGFRDDAVNEILGVDGVNEASFYAVFLGNKQQ